MPTDKRWSDKRWYLGKLKGSPENVYLYDFSWDCGWYWGGGYIGNRNFHAHFDGAFLNTVDSRGHTLNSRGWVFVDPWNKSKELEYVAVERKMVIENGASVWQDLAFFLDDAQYTTDQWWRIKDLFKQFYRLRDAAEVFQYGGHCTSTGRTDAEINKELAANINNHIKTVIIPEIRKALDKA